MGTGAIFGLEHNSTHTPWLVTAKHVFQKRSQSLGPPPASNSAFLGSMKNRRLNILESGLHSNRETNNTGSLTPTPRLIWPVYRFPSPQKQTGRKILPKIRFEDFGTTEEIYEGAPLMLLGYPEAVGPDMSARALVRQGLVSWVSPTKPKSTLFYIDGHIFPGSSGGPVFKLPAGIDRQGHFASLGDVSFLGIVTQTRIHQIPLIAGGQEIEITFQRKKVPENTPLPKLYRYWSCRTGISSQAITLLRIQTKKGINRNTLDFCRPILLPI